MKVGVIGAGTMGSGIAQALTMNLPETVKRKSLKDLKRE